MRAWGSRRREVVIRTMPRRARQNPPQNPVTRWWVLWGVLALGVVIGALHGRALHYGLFMDDYAHFQQLRACDWSLRGLTDACRLELVGGVIDLWWLPEVTLRFFRPVSFGVMKLTYTLFGWSPVALHVASLLWHLAACTLLMLLLRRLGASRRLSWAVAALFAIHPAHVATVQWIASQTELMVTTLVLGAMLCWANFRGWPGPAAGDARDGGMAARRSPGGRLGWLAACLLLFVLALGCRENAVMLPLVLLCVEPLLRRAPDRQDESPGPVGAVASPGTRRVWAAVALLVALIGGYLVVRTHYLGGAALPPKPYVIPPTDPDFFRYIFDKTCYYLLGEFLLVPCVPIGGLAYFRAHPLPFYGLSLVVVVVLVTLVGRHRARLAGWLGPACLLGFMAPVLPAFESPHHLYLPGVGWAIMTMLFFQWVGGFAWGRVSAGARSPRPSLMWLSILLTGLVFGTATALFGFALDTAQGVEDEVVAEIASAPVPVRDGETLYIANLPMIAHYVRLALEQRTGRHGLHVVALTWSTRLLGMVSPAELRRVDARTIELRLDQERYFSGPLRLLNAEATGRPPPVSGAQLVSRDDFTVTCLDADADGVRALRFTFRSPVPRSGVHLFWGSPIRWAWQVPQPRGEAGERAEE